MPMPARSPLCPPPYTLPNSQSIAAAPHESSSAPRPHRRGPSPRASELQPHQTAPAASSTPHQPVPSPPSKGSAHPAAACPQASIHRLFQHAQQILPIAALCDLSRQQTQLLCIDISQPIHDLFRTGHLQSLPLLNRMDEHRRVQQRVVRPRVEPRDAPSKHLRAELSPLQIPPVHIRNLELPARRRLQPFCHSHHLRVVKINSRHCIARLRLQRLLFNRNSPSLPVELHHAIPLRIEYRIGKHRSTVRTRSRLLQSLREVMSVKDVVAQHQATTFTSTNLFAEP